MSWLLRDGQVLASLEVAGSSATGSRVLAGRAVPEGALLLEHRRGVHSLGARFAMDVAFLDAERVVVDTVTLKPFRTTLPRLRARSVLEAREGAFERWRLKVGDQLEIKE